MRKLLRFFIGSMALVSASHAIAADIVFDPTNFVRNTVTAAQSVRQTSELVTSNMHQYNQYRTMLQNLQNMSKSQVTAVIARGVANGLIKSTNPDAAVAEANGVYGNFQELHQTMNGMGNVYDQLNTHSSGMNRLAANSGLSWEELYQAELDAAKNGQIATAQNYNNLQSLLMQLGNFQQRADSIAGRIPLNQGAVESLSTLSAQNHLMTDQMSGLLQSSISQAQASNMMLRKQEMEAENSVNQTRAANENRKKTVNIFSTTTKSTEGE